MSKDIAVMEVGRIFKSWTIDGELLFASGIKCGQFNKKNCHTEARLFDVFDIKADVEVALNFMNLSIEKCPFINIDLPYYHTYITKYFEIKEEVFAFEINIANIPFDKPKFGRRNEFIVSDFQPTFRDYAFTIEERQPIGEILNCIKSLDKKIIKSIDLFDIYSGPKVPPRKKSIAFKVQLQADNRTLDESELCQLSEVIISTIKKKFKGN